MVDVTVRGAGIFGLSIAWACLRRGARVCVIDPNGPGAGASGGLLGALAPHVPENWNPKKAFQFESLLLAGPFWTEVEAIGGQPSGYGRTGRLQPIANDQQRQQAVARAETAKDLWEGEAQWRVIPADPDNEWSPVSPSGYLIHDTLTARMNPRQATASIAAALTALGATITPDGPDRGQVVHATGIADLARLNEAFGKTVGTPIKGQGALLSYAAPDAPQIFADALHIIPHADGTTAIGSTTEREFDDPKGTDDQLEALIEKARQIVPALKSAAIIDRWAGLRPRSRSRAPMLGDHPLHPGQYIANGGFKIGFGMAPKVAEVMAELILNDHDDIPDDFRPDASL